MKAVLQAAIFLCTSAAAHRSYAKYFADQAYAVYQQVIMQCLQALSC
jgi:hypothetical protein